MAKSPKVMPPNWRDAKFTKVKVPRNWPKDKAGIARWNTAVDAMVNRELAQDIIDRPFLAALKLQRYGMDDNRFSCLANIEDIKKLKNLTRKKMEHLIAHERGHAEWRVKEANERAERARVDAERASVATRQAREKIVELERTIRAIRMLTETAKLDVMFQIGKDK